MNFESFYNINITIFHIIFSIKADDLDLVMIAE